MKIGELARGAGTNAETVRYYERIGLLPQPDRTDGNYRDYGPPDVERLAFIRHARSLGFELPDVRSLVALAEERESDCSTVDRIASRHLEAVRTKIARLTALESELDRLLKRCRGGQTAECKIIGALQNHDRCEGHSLPS